MTESLGAPGREQELVELVDPDGRAAGQATVAEAHRAPGMPHRAFSIFLRDSAGRVLLQQRAAAKTRFPLRWANTCCGHPWPGEPLLAAAARRLEEEVGVKGVRLTEVGVHRYRAEDPATGRVEHEHDHVLIGEVSDIPILKPDPAEIASVRWVPQDVLADSIAAAPDAYAPWLPGVTSVLLRAGS